MNKIKLTIFSVWDYMITIDNEQEGLSESELMAKAETSMRKNIEDLVNASHTGSVEIELSNSQYGGFTVASLVEYFAKHADYDIRTHTYRNKFKSFIAVINIDNWPLKDRKFKEEKQWQKKK